MLASLALATALPVGRAAAQEAEADTLIQGWETELSANLAASQANYENWTEGGINTINATAGLTGAATGRSADWEQAYDLRLAFGLVKQDTLDFRKAADVIDLRGSLQYRGGGFFQTFNPIVALSARTQFAAGFNYDRNPFEDERGLPVKVADFFAPATFTQSLGLSYDPAPWFKQRLGLAAKETAVEIRRLRPLYGLDAGQPVRYEVGLESRTEVDREVFENVRLRSSLNLFASFNQTFTETRLPDVLWENLITMEVNAWLGVDFEFVTLYDRDLSQRLQLKEVLALTVSFAIL